MGYQPSEPILVPPLYSWPPRPVAAFRWLIFEILFPWGLCWIALAFISWNYLTHSEQTMAVLEPDWIGIIWLRNAVLLLMVAGGLHWWLYIRRSQKRDFKYNTRWQSEGSQKFLWKNQVKDNMFWSLASGATIWTLYEIFMLWAYGKGWAPFVTLSSNPILFVGLAIILPFWQDLHFYIVHRISHWKPIYKCSHYLHHRNTNVGPWSGLSMHPIEHLLYFSGILIHWIVLSHPLHALLHVQATGLTPALGHLGFDKYLFAGKTPLTLGQRYFHYLHHKYFECNYGGDGTVPMDKWFGSFHDGTEEGDALIKKRRQKMHGTG